MADVLYNKGRVSIAFMSADANHERTPTILAIQIQCLLTGNCTN